METNVIVDRLLAVMETQIAPLTRDGVARGDKVYGAAVLRKADLSVVIAGTNRETANPLFHGEIATLMRFYEMPAEQRPDPADCVFLSTHEPCSMCLSGIAWCGFDRFYYFFGYADTRDAFEMPHDLRILSEVFGVENGRYRRENAYWTAYRIGDLIGDCDAEEQAGFERRCGELQRTYNTFFDTSESVRATFGAS